MKIMVTGGAGFLGSRVVARLEQRGTDWIVVPRSADCDLRDPAAARALMERFRPELVIHAAARVGGIEANRTRPAEFFYENAMMGLNTLHAAHLAGVGKFVFLGSVCSYPAFTPVPFREENLWDGYPEPTNGPYGMAKKMTMVAAEAYRAQYGMNAINLLVVNLYGPGDSFDPQQCHVVPALIRRFVEARDRQLPSVTLWGTGTPTREFLYVDDAAEAVVLASERYDGAEPVNVGSAQEISIGELARTIAELVGYQGRLEWDTSKPDGQQRRCLDVSRARERFGFEARTPLREGLQRTIEWFLAHAPAH